MASSAQELATQHQALAANHAQAASQIMLVAQQQRALAAGYAAQSATQQVASAPSSIGVRYILEKVEEPYQPAPDLTAGPSQVGQYGDGNLWYVYPANYTFTPTPNVPGLQQCPTKTDGVYDTTDALNGVATAHYSDLQYHDFSQGSQLRFEGYQVIPPGLDGSDHNVGHLDSFKFSWSWDESVVPFQSSYKGWRVDPVPSSEGKAIWVTVGSPLDTAPIFSLVVDIICAFRGYQPG